MTAGFDSLSFQHASVWFTVLVVLQYLMCVQELLQAQRDGMARQDQTLDRVETSVSRVHRQAVAVRDEVEGQVRLVETLDYDIDNAQGRVAHVVGKVEEVLQKMDRRLYYLFCFAVPFMLAFIFVLILRAIF